MMTNTPLIRYPFPNIANFRDVGGYAAGDGHMVRFGLFFRSARLTTATPDEIAQLKKLGIRTVLDLRMDEEVSTRPDAGMDDPDFGFQHLSLMQNVELTEDIQTIMQNPDKVPPMSTFYQFLMDNGMPAFKKLIEAIAEGVQKGAVLFHCTAGKDRTGMTAMLLQAICGVDRLDMIAHYEVSRTYNLEFIPQDMTGSNPDNMMNLLDHLQEKYGGPVAYLLKAGVSQAAMDTIRSHFRVPIEG